MEDITELKKKNKASINIREGAEGKQAMERDSKNSVKYISIVVI